MSLTAEQRAERLRSYVDALINEWGATDAENIADELHQFIEGGYDLSAYEDKPRLRLINGGAV